MLILLLKRFLEFRVILGSLQALYLWSGFSHFCSLYLSLYSFFELGNHILTKGNYYQLDCSLSFSTQSFLTGFLLEYSTEKLCKYQARFNPSNQVVTVLPLINVVFLFGVIERQPRFPLSPFLIGTQAFCFGKDTQQFVV